MASMQEEMVLANLRMALLRLINAVEGHEEIVDDDDEVADALMQAKQALNKAR